MPDPSPDRSPARALPRFGLGSIVRHLQFGSGRVVAYEPAQYVIVFKGGDTRRVAFSFDGLEPHGQLHRQWHGDEWHRFHRLERQRSHPHRRDLGRGECHTD